MTAELPGALVISLDFELHWGVRDKVAPDGAYRANLLGARRAIPRILALFEEYGVAATWATVGLLFARTRAEAAAHFPERAPGYRDPRLSPYGEAIGEDEANDPLHFGASLLDGISRVGRQEIATHTFSHYYCLEEGQSREDFAADLRSARAIAAARGIDLRSIVFPRNQHNPAYDDLLRDAGIVCYRGNQPAPPYRAVREADLTTGMRAVRLADSYLPIHGRHTTAWEEVRQPSGLANVPASLFLRPFHPRLAALEPLRLARIGGTLDAAARRRRIAHLWWHPHNFGAHLTENLAFLRAVLERFARLRDRYGMRSMTMHEVAELSPGSPR